MLVPARRRPAAAVVLSAALAGAATLVLPAAPAGACPIEGHHGHNQEPPTPARLPGSAFATRNMRMMSRLDRSQLAAPGASTTAALASAWGWKDSLTGREYALVARTTDLAIVDVTRSWAPKLVGNVARTAGTAATTWRDVRVVGDWAYIGADGENAGVQAFNLTRVRNVTTPTVFTADARLASVSNSHTLATNFSNPTAPYVYAVGANTMAGVPGAPQTPGGMQVIDVSNPAAPQIRASWQADGYVHETSVFTYSGPDAQHVGKTLAFNCNGGPGNDPNVFSIVDVSNPSAGVTRVGRAGYPQSTYTHQG